MPKGTLWCWSGVDARGATHTHVAGLEANSVWCLALHGLVFECCSYLDLKEARIHQVQQKGRLKSEGGR